MTARDKSGLSEDRPAIRQADAGVAAASRQPAPIVQRLSSHRDRVNLAIKGLRAEHKDLISKRDELRRHTEALERGFAHHLEDIEATLSLYESGLNPLAAGQCDKRS
ncbi:MAG TPA: hypothetical protein VIL88_11510 [Devosia sp.]|uniref:hypothetical protein n=1 Tax=Devosia sp. TaxID=1871048 RepID=UPI002F94294D